MSTQVGDAHIDVDADLNRFRRNLRRLAAQDIRNVAKQLQTTFAEDLDLDKATNMEEFRRNLARTARDGNWDRFRNNFRDTKVMAEDLRREIQNISRLRTAGGELFMSEQERDRLLSSLDLYTKTMQDREALELRKSETDEIQKQGFLQERARREAHGDFMSRLRWQKQLVENTQRMIASEEEANQRAEARRRDDFFTRLRFQKRVVENTQRLIKMEKDADEAAAKRRSNEFFARLRYQKRLVESTQRLIQQDAVNVERRRKAWDDLGRLQERAHREMVYAMAHDYDKVYIGRLRGSRNDFLHFMGGIGGAIERMIGRSIEPAVSGAQRLINAFANGMARAFGEGNLATEGLRGFANVLPRLVPAIAGVTVALGAFVLILQMAASLLSGLAAMVVGVASSIGSALMGVLAAAGPIALALGVALGTIVVGIKGMTDEMKPGLQPIKDWFGEIQRVVAQNLFGNLKNQMSGLVDILREFAGPMMEDTATRLSSTIDRFVAVLHGPDFRNTMGTLTTELPKIAGNLADSLSSILTGLFGFFSAIAPSVSEITDGIASALENWSAWVNSAAGQNSIKKWFDDAWESVEAVWDLLGAVWSTLGEIFGIGDDTGNDWIQGWTDGLNRFTESLREGGDGRQGLLDWFDRAVELGRSLGDFVDDLAGMFRDLDTENASENLGDFISALGDIADAVGWVSGLVDNITNLFEVLESPPEFERWVRDNIPALEGLWDALSAVDDAVFGFFDALREFPGKAAAWVDSVDEAIDGFFSGLLDGALSAWDAVSGWWTGTAWPWISGLPGEVASAIGDWFDPFYQSVRDTWGRVQGWFDSTFSGFFSDMAATTARWAEDIWGPLGDLASQVWNEKIVPWWNDTVLGFFDNTASEAGDSLGAMWDGLTSGLADAWAGVTSWWSGSVLPWFGEVGDVVAQEWATFWSPLTDFLSAAWSQATTWWNDSVVPWLGEVRDVVAQEWATFWSPLTGGLSTAWDAITSWWNDTAVPFFTETLPAFFTETLPQVGHDLVQGLLQGISDAWAGFTDWVAGLVEGFIQGVKDLFGIASPSTVFAEIGGFIVQGIWDGISGAWDAFWGFVSGIFGNLVTAAQDTWNTITDAASTAWSGISSAASTAWSGIQTTLRNAWSNISTTASTTASAVRETVSTAWTNIRTTTSNVWSGIRTFHSNAWSGIRSTATSAATTVGATVINGWNRIRTSTSTAWTAVRSAVTSAMSRLRESVSTGIRTAISTVAAMPGQIRNRLSNLGSTLRSAGRNLMEGFRNGITSMASSLATAARNVASGAVNKVKNFLGIASPSKVFMQIGRQTAEGMILGISGETSAVAQAALGMAKAMEVPFDNAFTTGQNAGRALAKGLSMANPAISKALDDLSVRSDLVTGSVGTFSAGGSGKTVNVSEGAIQIQAPLTDPELAARIVLDDFASAAL